MDIQRLKHLNKHTKIFLVFFILGISTFVIIPLLIASGGAVLGYVSLIGPEKYIDIIYPADKSEVPAEFHVAGISTFRIGGIVDHSTWSDEDSSKINLTTYGLKGSLSIDGREYLSSTETGTMHIYKVKLEEGKHDIVFSTILGSKTIQVFVKKDISPGFREVAPHERPSFSSSEKEQECNIKIKMNKEYIYTTFNDHTEKYMVKDIPLLRRGSRLVYPIDDKSMAESFRCYGNYAVAAFAEMDERSSEEKSDTRFHHFLMYFTKNKILFIEPPSSYSVYKKDFNVHITEKGTIILNEGSGHIYYWDGREWKKIYLPVVLANDNHTVYTSSCGSPKYDASAAKYLKSAGVTFEPCSPEFDIFMYKGKPFVESRAMQEMFKSKLYQIME